jgi:serine/threonine protein kinase
MAPEIVAPELLNIENTDKDKNHYDFSADLWSVGVITYFLFLHKFPFESKN